jgi:hypothetical protein
MNRTVDLLVILATLKIAKSVAPFRRYMRKTLHLSEKTAAVLRKPAIVSTLWLFLRKTHFPVEFPIW